MVLVQMHFFLLMNKQGKVRLAKWFSTYPQKERTRITKEVANLVLPRDSQVTQTSHLSLFTSACMDLVFQRAFTAIKRVTEDILDTNASNVL